MKRKLFSLLLMTSLSALLAGSCLAGELPEGAVLVPAESAAFTEGEGITIDNEKMPTAYDPEHGMIVNLGKGGEVTYTLPEGIEGSYDIYLTVSKMMVQFGTQPFVFALGDEVFSVPVDCPVSADSPFNLKFEDGVYDTGSHFDPGRVLILENASLTAGETFTVTAAFGSRAPSLKGQDFPALGDLLLVPAGTPVAVGFDEPAIPEEEEPDPKDPLSGLDIFWIGSSVTYGAHSAGHYAMADAIADAHPGTTCEKYAISATTLVNQSEESYVNRLKLIPKTMTPDLIVVQLSTNDATTGKPFGEISEGFDPASFDDTTIAGAIETIISYAQETFGCPVVFYSGSFTVKENYKEMVDLLLQIQEKWGIGVVDLFNNQEMTDIYDTDLYHEYMSDEVHPTRKGYVEWWTPVFEKELGEYMASLKQ